MTVGRFSGGATWDQVVWEGFSEEVVLEVRPEMRSESWGRALRAEGTARAEREQQGPRGNSKGQEETARAKALG